MYGYLLSFLSFFLKKFTSKVTNRVGHVRPKRYKTRYSEYVHGMKISGDDSDAAASSQALNESKCNKTLHEGTEEQLNVGISTFQNSLPLPEIENVCEPERNATPSQDLMDSESDTCYVTFEEENENAGEHSALPPTSESVVLEDLISRLKDENEQWGASNIDDEFNDFEEEEFADDATIDGEEFVQPGHTMTTSTSVLLIWMYIITHSLTSAQASDLLALINLHLLFSNPALKSLHHLKKFFIQLKTPMVKHYFCSYCFTFVQQDAKCCPNDMCGKNLKLKGALDWTLQINYQICSQRMSFEKI